MSINADYQKLEPGNDIRLIEVDGTSFGVSDILRFHNYNIAHTEEEIIAAGGNEENLPAKSLWWQGEEYRAWPYKIEGIDKSTSGTSASPKLTVANIDSSITALCLAYDDMLQAVVTIHDTLSHYLDAKNFAEGNPQADPTQEKLQRWNIDAKTNERPRVDVEFTLASPLDFQGVMIPTRQMHSLCTWCIRGKYRSGDGCDYAGTKYFDKYGNPVDDPSLDECNGTLKACKDRFGAENELPHGGFVGTSLIRS
ncbi:phage minor tail protein L [Pseudocitrobacter sp. 2023EL-00150]|uniref:phage minor tail protein L n=1 Tax=Pseudocitrobacter sp. 2023EL-00150 TaxID=3032322 RepID=UPI0023E3FB0C|nr:phage minor tail protein L [Pseudocitrobacter sp. 2023EL-00150]MDF3830230.1 phage minor tail protein L [Pseudocitrobacter sp. 2023EL-00150]